MRRSIRGWRSARFAAPGVPQPVGASAAPLLAMRPTGIPQERFRLGLGLLALAFYLWVIHSYKLPAGDVAVLGLAAGVLARGGTMRVPVPLWIFLGFIAWSALSLFVTASVAITGPAIIALIKLWVIVFCIVNVVRNAADLRFVIIAWLALFAMYPVRGAFYNQYICHCTDQGRVSWNFIFENPNDLAAMAFIPLGLAAGLAYVERVKLWKFAGAAGVAVLALLIMLTQSRGAMLALGASAILLPLTSRRRGRDLALLVILVGVAAIAAPKGVWERLSGLTKASVQGGMADVDPEGSAEGRWKIWQVAGATVRDHPILGVGAGMMPTTHRFEALRRGFDYTVLGLRDTHSTYLRIAAETGIPGLIIYLAMWVSLFLHVRRVRRKIKEQRLKDYQFLLFLELSMMAFMIASLFGSYGWLSFTYLSIAVAWLAATILEQESWYVPDRAMATAGAATVPGMRRR